MSLTQLDPPLHLETPKGAGWAHFVIDYGPETNLLWVVFLDQDGACWTVPNSEIRMSWNWTLGRRKPGEAIAEVSDSPPTVRSTPADTQRDIARDYPRDNQRDKLRHPQAPVPFRPVGGS